MEILKCHDGSILIYDLSRGLPPYDPAEQTALGIVIHGFFGETLFERESKSHVTGLPIGVTDPCLSLGRPKPNLE